MISEGGRFDQITVLTVLTLLIRKDRPEQSVDLIRYLATFPAILILHTFTGREMDLLKRVFEFIQGKFDPPPPPPPHTHTHTNSLEAIYIQKYICLGLSFWDKYLCHLSYSNYSDRHI